MKIHLTAKLPLFTLSLAGLCLCLRIWLLSTADEQGLLKTGHFAGVLCFILFALLLGVLFMGARSLSPVSRSTQLFPANVWSAVGCIAGAVGIVYALFSVGGMGVLTVLHTISGIAAAASLVFSGYCRFTGRKSPFLLHVVLTVYLMCHLVICCRTWGAEPQLQIYFFPFVGSIFLLLTAYQRAALEAGQTQRIWYVIFNQAAVFCCLLAATGHGKLFYLAMAAWAGTNLCSLQSRPRRQRPQTEEA